MRKTISIFIAFSLMLSLLPATISSAVAAPTYSLDAGTGYVAYVNNDIIGQQTVEIKGDVYSAFGNVNFSNMSVGSVSSNVYYNASKIFTNSSQVPVAGTIHPLSATSFNGKSYIPDVFPVIDHSVASYTAGWSGTHVVSQNTSYGSLNVLKELIVDTTAGDIFINVNTLTLNSYEQPGIVIRGNHNLYLQVNSNFTVNGKINASGDKDKAHIFHTKGVFTIGGSADVRVNANVYQADNSSDVVFSGSGLLTGNIITNGDSIKISGGANGDPNMIGVLYAPRAAVEISASGTLKGRLVANSLALHSSGYLFYGEANGGPLSLPRFTEPSEPDVPLPNNPLVPSGEPYAIEYAYAYLYGYGDTGLVGPIDNITREQAAALLHRILKQNGLAEFEYNNNRIYADLSPDRWSAVAIQFMTNKKIFDGSKSKIYPDQAITRGEAAKIISMALNIAPDNTKPNSLRSFTDIDLNNEYYYYVKALYDSGYLLGYGGLGTETIGPNNTLTRAHVVTIINRLIGRDDRYDISNVKSPYTDISANDWYYADIVRASYGFSEKSDGSGNYQVDPTKWHPRETIDYQN